MIHFLVALALCYILVKIPFWILGSLRGGGKRRSLVGSLVRGFIMAKTFGLLRGSGGSTVAAATARRSGTKTAATPDAYAKSRTTADGQYMLPLRGLRRTRPSRTAGQNATSQASRPPSPKSAGQQLKLPLDGQWPENKPRVGRDGQYRLPFNLKRQPTPASKPTPPLPIPPPRSSARQLRLPADGQWPEHRPRLGRDGQYRLALDVHRTRTPAKPTPPAPPPRPPRRERDRQLPLPLNLPKIPSPRTGSGRDGGDRS